MTQGSTTRSNYPLKPGASKVGRFIAKSASGTFFLRIFYLGSGFATTLLLTRWLGAEGLGVYNFVISWIVLSVIFVKFGFEDYMTREIAVLRADDDAGAVKSLWQFVFRFMLLSSGGAASIYFVLINSLSFENPHLQPTFLLAILMIPLLCFLGIYRGLFRGTKNIISSQMPEYLFRPAQTLFLVGIMLLLSVPGQPEYAMLITVFGSLTAVSFCILRNPVRSELVQADKKELDPKVWLAGAFPFLLIAGIHIFNQRTDRLMLGSIIDMKSVGYYSVAIQMALVVNFPLVGITAAIGPLIAEQKNKNADRQELQKALHQTTLIATFVSILIIGSLALFGPWVLEIFGEDFDESYIPMLVLAVGQLANVAAGPAGAILSMSNHERLVAIGVLASAILNLILNYFLIPILGVLGAGMATAISMATWNIVLVIIAKRKLGIDANFAAFLIPKPARLKHEA
ncbi:MAG: flippase [Planctomycetota bacterium]